MPIPLSDGTTAQQVAAGGKYFTPIAAGVTSNTAIIPNQGVLVSILVTTSGTNPMVFTDIATGTKIGALAASAPIGTYTFNNPCGSQGFQAVGNAANPAVTVFFS